MLLERGTKFLLGIREIVLAHPHPPDEPLADILNRFNGEVANIFEESNSSKIIATFEWKGF